MRTFEERIQQLIDVHGDRELYDFAVHVYHSGFADGLGAIPAKKPETPPAPPKARIVKDGGGRKQ